MIEELYKIFLQHPSVQTDTRKLKTGDIFFALKGPAFNGNAFAKEAINKGAVLAIIDEESFAIPGKTFVVPDVLTALQQLALFHRKQFLIPFIAITGSNGKTTTKELIHAVLSTTFKTYTTEGNLNNHIGIPLTLLKIKPNAQMAVIEMGANHLHEIESYCTIARPTHGLITNCGKAHLEGFGSEEGVRKGKGELFDFLKQNNGTAFVMWDYDYLRQMSKGIPQIIRYGTADAEVEGMADSSGEYLQVKMKKGLSEVIRTQLVGDYNLPNVLAAVCLGIHFGVPDEKIIAAIENYIPSNSRSQLIEKGTNKIIMDAYNANPSSMKLAIENLAHMAGENKILMLGAMAELGETSLEEHQAILDLIKQFRWKEVILVGDNFKKLNPPYPVFENSLLAKEWYQQQQYQNSFILVKGSRSMQMEKILEP
jgi:UDP-N-acetylmuramoyl-tripeptide--D-alanyl-D-alanine ligase